MSPEFLVTTIILTATPGTGAVFTAAAAISHGIRSGLAAAAGCTLGMIPHLALALTGAAALLAASAVAFESLRWIGVAYLLYMAWGTWRSTSLVAPQRDIAPSVRRTIATAILVNLPNPKLTLYFFVMIPMFVDPGAPGALPQMIRLGAAAMAITLAIFAAYALAASWLRRYVIGRPRVERWTGRVFALTFVLLAAFLALTPRS